MGPPVVETILCVAALAPPRADGVPGQFICSMPRPARHGDIVQRMPKEWWGTQGFLTSTGRFVSRKEAWVIAEAAGQILRCTSTSGPGTLYSEDLW